MSSGPSPTIATPQLPTPTNITTRRRGGAAGKRPDDENGGHSPGKRQTRAAARAASVKENQVPGSPEVPVGKVGHEAAARAARRAARRWHPKAPAPGLPPPPPPPPPPSSLAHLMPGEAPSALGQLPASLAHMTAAIPAAHAASGSNGPDPAAEAALARLHAMKEKYNIQVPKRRFDCATEQTATASADDLTTTPPPHPPPPPPPPPPPREPSFTSESDPSPAPPLPEAASDLPSVPSRQLRTDADEAASAASSPCKSTMHGTQSTLPSDAAHETKMEEMAPSLPRPRKRGAGERRRQRTSSSGSSSGQSPPSGAPAPPPSQPSVSPLAQASPPLPSPLQTPLVPPPQTTTTTSTHNSIDQPIVQLEACSPEKASVGATADAPDKPSSGAPPPDVPATGRDDQLTSEEPAPSSTPAAPVVKAVAFDKSMPPPRAPPPPPSHPPPTRIERAATAPANMLPECTAADPAALAPSKSFDAGLANRRDAIDNGPAAAFTAFLIAADTSTVLETFEDLLGATGVPANSGRQMLEKLRVALLPHLKFRQAQLLNKLHERRTAGAYAESMKAFANGRPVLRVLVLGGGPIGLRCAVELAMLGHSVLALEQRTCFTRLNVLHLWESVSHDLAELGIKALDPSVFASADFAHVGTSQLQHSLLKIALLLGVQMRLGAQVRDLADLRVVEPSKRRSLEWPEKVRFSIEPSQAASMRASMRASMLMSPMPTANEEAIFTADVLVDATGARCPLFNAIGFEQVSKGAATLAQPRAACRASVGRWMMPHLCSHHVASTHERIALPMPCHVCCLCR